MRALLSKFFKVAMQQDVVEFNPVADTPRPGEERRRERVLSAGEIRQFWKATDALEPQMAAFRRLRLLTAQRGGEVANMTWSELDLDGGWWTIPPERSKNKMSHRVPPSETAITILKDLKTRREQAEHEKEKQSPFVLYGARRTRDQHDAAQTFGLKDFTGHDLRRTAASLMAGGGTSRLVVSKILNHVESGVTAIYDRHSYDPEKRVALDAWDRMLKTILEDKKANVVPFARG